MVFSGAKLDDVPDTVPICDFMFDEKHGRYPIAKSLDTYTDGLDGRTISARDQKTRVDHLARALLKEFGWKVNGGTEYDKVVGVFALNTIDTMTLSWAIHRLNGISSPANAAYTADELAYQLTNSGAQALFTTAALLDTALTAAAKAKIPKHKVYLFEVPGPKPPPEFKTLGQLLKEGQALPELEGIKWSKGQGARQTAFLCYSSGTSGLPKGVMISHRNVIANTLQIAKHDQSTRDKYGKDYLDVALGLLPQSHIYGLIVVCHASTYRGDRVIVLPKFEMSAYLDAIVKYKINTLYIVPPVIINMVNNNALLSKYDLTSVTSIFTGAAPLGEETAKELGRQYPSWGIRQGYGMTETATVVCSTLPHDVVFGSSGPLVPGQEVKIMSAEGKEIKAYGETGELCVKGPNVVLGYLKNDKANAETFVDGPDGRWLRTGDEAMIKKSSKTGVEHVWITDRIKELIKVKGLQVAPAELESFLLDHPAVADAAVIGVPDDRAGEVPKAFVVKSSSVDPKTSDEELQREISAYVEKTKSRHKWLKGGVEFIDAVPKSPSGKILRRFLRDQEKEKRRKAGAKL